MKFLFSILATFVAVAGPVLTGAALSALKVDGGNLVYSDSGDRFLVRGAAYDFPVHDDDSNWQDAFDRLLDAAPDINFIRIYDIDPDYSYSNLLSYTSSKGIYLAIPLTPNSYSSYVYCALARDGTPELSSTTCYPSCLLNFGEQILAKFSNYNQVATFVVANEVFQNSSNLSAGPCVKGYVRDLKNFQSSCSSMRAVPLMYAGQETDAFDSSDVASSDQIQMDYLTCGSTSESIDLFGLNVFRWCNTDCSSSSNKCGMQDIHDAFADGQRVPIILSEYGCALFYDSSNTVVQRTWTQVPYYYSSSFWDVVSGGVSYAYGKGEVTGSDFSFFSGEDDTTHTPGTTKTCSSTNSSDCNVDNFGSQLSAIVSAAKKASKISSVSTDLTCPTVSGLSTDLPDTRQGADGFVAVSCPSSDSSNSTESDTGDATSTAVTSAGLVVSLIALNLL